MRPLRLRIKGLRSYRTEVVIDFSDAGLFAVVGDTGSGKSSILEAMTYALYSATTWDQRSVHLLIAEGAPTMVVALDFSVDGQVYRVTRSTSRTAYPQATHKLECLSQPGLLSVDGRAGVTTEIERLVGLRWEAFISAIVLPQGRFDRLLQESPANRAGILKSIFRLEQLETLREDAKNLADRLAPAVKEFEIRRRLLLEDPVSEREKARSALAAAEALITRLGGLRTDLDKLAEQRRAQLEAARKADEERSGLEVALAAADTPHYEELRARDAALRPEIDGAHTADVLAASAEADAERAVAEAVNRGDDLATVTRHATTLEGMLRDLPLIASEASAVELEASQITSSDLAQSAAQARLSQAATDASKADVASQGADQAYEAAAGVLTSAETLILRYRELEQAVTTAVATRDVEAPRLDAANSGVVSAEVEERAARETVQAMAAHVSDLERRDAAAHLAAGVGPGDLCPICARKLPASFSRPVAGDLAEARREASTATEVYGVAAERATQARTLATTVTEGFRLAQLALTTAEGRVAEVLAEVSAALGAFTPDAPDDQSLEALRATLSVATEARATARLKAETARVAASTLSGEFRVAAESLEQRRKAHRERHERHAERQAAVAARIAGLPADLRPSDEPGHDIATLDTAIKNRLLASQQLADVHARSRESRNQTRAELARLHELLAAEVDLPRGGLRTAHAVLRAATLRAATDEKIPAAPNETIDLVDEAEWARRVRDAATRVADALSESARAAVTAADGAIASSQARLAEAGLADESALSQAIRQGTGDERVAREALERAEREIPLVADLDARLDEGETFIAVLRELASLMTDGTFIGHVVVQRQRALLAIASEILGSVSSGRYGFSDDFQIVDRQSGQARSSRTLSGGETFQASLSLALGLVELAARGGGRLDALFLDEGFGALDTNALHEALSELERRASRGRLVGVVSHIRAVAEGIEEVLLVTRGSAGSQARWISRNERETEIDRELGEGLLS